MVLQPDPAQLRVTPGIDDGRFRQYWSTCPATLGP